VSEEKKSFSEFFNQKEKEEKFSFIDESVRR
jgi:hypothetical protein